MSKQVGEGDSMLDFVMSRVSWSILICEGKEGLVKLCRVSLYFSKSIEVQREKLVHWDIVHVGGREECTHFSRCVAADEFIVNLLGFGCKLGS